MNNFIKELEVKIDDLKESGDVIVPNGYNYKNCIRIAFQMLSSKTEKIDNKYMSLLEYCTKKSIADSILSMVIQGLSPSKNQCYFIRKHNKLTLMRSYFGSMAVLKRISNVIDVSANIIFEGDDFAFEIDCETGKKKISKHIQSFDNIGNNIKGAYCLIVTKDGSNHLEVMNYSQIKMAFAQTNSRNNRVQKDFEDQMALRTVINRASKYYINTCPEDNESFIKAVNETLSNEFENELEVEEETKDIDIDTSIKNEAKEVDVKQVSFLQPEPEPEPELEPEPEPEPELELKEEEEIPWH